MHKHTSAVGGIPDGTTGELGELFNDAPEISPAHAQSAALSPSNMWVFVQISAYPTSCPTASCPEKPSSLPAGRISSCRVSFFSLKMRYSLRTAQALNSRTVRANNQAGRAAISTLSRATPNLGVIHCAHTACGEIYAHSPRAAVVICRESQGGFILIGFSPRNQLPQRPGQVLVACLLAFRDTHREPNVAYVSLLPVCIW